MAFHWKKPVVPFKGDVLEGLEPGSLFVIKGKIPSSSNSFNINLCGPHQVEFHISIRLEKGTVVRNHLVAGEWGPEETVPRGMDGLKRGQEFEMTILTEQNHYQVSVNGTPSIYFAHRLPFEDVRLLHIEGGVQLESVQYKIIETYDPPPAYTEKPEQVIPKPGRANPATSSCIHVERPFRNPKIPLLYPILNGLRVGYAAKILGKPAKNAKSVRFDFLCGRGPYPDPDTAFHLSIRFDDEIVVLNSFLHNQWGPEQRIDFMFPFSRGANFELFIKVHQGQFDISVDGLTYSQFIHRVKPLYKIDYFQINGDVEIFQFEIQRTPLFIPNVVMKSEK